MRYEFNKTQKRQMAERSGGICEAGRAETHAFYGMAPNDNCERKAIDFDHIIATGLAQTPILDIDEGAHVCLVHHKIKTHVHDRPKIQKAKNIREKAIGITKPKKAWPSRKFSSAYKSNTKFINGDIK
jgi:5-methylcytosine-specific restriction enzyme A